MRTWLHHKSSNDFNKMTNFITNNQKWKMCVLFEDWRGDRPPKREVWGPHHILKPRSILTKYQFSSPTAKKLSKRYQKWKMNVSFEDLRLDPLSIQQFRGPGHPSFPRRIWRKRQKWPKSCQKDTKNEKWTFRSRIYDVNPSQYENLEDPVKS